MRKEKNEPDPLCPHCKGSGGVQTGENEYSTCPCIEAITKEMKTGVAAEIDRLLVSSSEIPTEK